MADLIDYTGGEAGALGDMPGSTAQPAPAPATAAANPAHQNVWLDFLKNLAGGGFGGGAGNTNGATTGHNNSAAPAPNAAAQSAGVNAAATAAKGGLAGCCG